MSATELKHVLMDIHEPISLIRSAKETYGEGVVEVRHMLTGDMANLETDSCIERKELLDFISSVIGKKGKPGRIWEQLENMTANHEHCYVIIVGRFVEKEVAKYTSFTKKQFLGACASIGARYKVPVYHEETDEDSITLAKALMLKSGGERKSLNMVKRLTVTTDNVMAGMVSCVPTIGEVYGPRIVEEFNIKRAEDLSKLTVEDLMTIDGIGKVKAEKIKEWF